MHCQFHYSIKEFSCIFAIFVIEIYIQGCVIEMIKCPGLSGLSKHVGVYFEWKWICLCHVRLANVTP